jgi:mono/diheme cytochrome c family protein
MPGMAHSIANEANVLNEYDLNTWTEKDGSVISLRETSMPRNPVAGTIPRGAAATATTDSNFGSPAAAVQHTMRVMDKTNYSIPVTPNGSAPYYFEDSDTGRILATNQLLYNPYPITAGGLARGKELYNTFCAICHGEKGDGNGWLVDEANPNAVYPVAPAILINEEFTAASNGRMYHAIMYGKNVMGHYKDKISYEERWQVIHWIRSLQAKNAKLKYDADVNTLNAQFGVPVNSMNQMAANEMKAAMEVEGASDLENQPSNGEMDKTNTPASGDSGNDENVESHDGDHSGDH